MKKEQPSLWARGLGALELGREAVHDVKCASPRYYPLPFRAMVGSAILALGIVAVATDLARWYPLRAWWAGELVRRGDELQHRLTPWQLCQAHQATALKQAQSRGKERGYGLAQ